MVQTRGQQTGDQSPPGLVALQGITAEGDMVAMTVSSGNTLKQTVPVPGADHSAFLRQPSFLREHNFPQRALTDQESLTPPQGVGSLTQDSVSARENRCEHADSVSVPRGMNTHLLGATPHAGDGTRVTGISGRLEAVLAWKGL